MLSYARLPRVVFSVAMAALLGSLAVPARAATTTYTSVYTGGTLQIGVGSTGGVLLGGTGALTNNGTLIFNRSQGDAAAAMQLRPQ